jgi:hypothetical protein
MRHANKAMGVLLLSALALAAAYVIAYAIMLDGSSGARIRAAITGEPSYRWRSDEARTVFAPVHWVDRKLRPERWPEPWPVYRDPSDPDPILLGRPADPP